MMLLKSYLEGIDRSDEALFARKLQILKDNSTTDRQAVINLYAEPHLPLSVWQAITSAVLNAPPDAVAIRSAMRNTCRKWILNGKRVNFSSPRAFGRAVTWDRFCELLVALNYHPDTDAARAELQHILTLPVPAIQRRWQRRFIGRHVMWSTFSDDPSDAFSGLDGPADSIRCRLGLEQSERGSALLLFEYQLPIGISCRTPSMADACASDPWLYFFRPASKDDPHGWTMTWDECAHERSRPEVVHEPLTGATVHATPKLRS
jgi:hypothetical protein